MCWVAIVMMVEDVSFVFPGFFQVGVSLLVA